MAGIETLQWHLQTRAYYSQSKTKSFLGLPQVEGLHTWRVLWMIRLIRLLEIDSMWTLLSLDYVFSLSWQTTTIIKHIVFTLQHCVLSISLLWVLLCGEVMFCSGVRGPKHELYQSSKNNPGRNPSEKLPQIGLLCNISSVSAWDFCTCITYFTGCQSGLLVYFADWQPR